MQIRITKKNTAMAVLGIILFLVLLFCISKLVNNRKPYQNALKWEKGWTLSINNETIQPNDLSRVTFKAASKGSKVVLENRMPNIEHDSSDLRLWMCHSAIRVYVDDELIYEFGWERYQENRIIGNGFHWIPIDQGVSGKSIRIEYYPVEDNAFTSLSAIYLEETKDSIKDFVSDTFNDMCSGIFLVMFGVVIIFIVICMLCMSKKFTSLIYTALFSIAIGLWTLCNHSDIQLISDNFILNQYLEYYSLYLGSLMLLLFVDNIRNHEKRSKILLGLIITNIGLVMVTVFLHLLNIVQFPSMLTFYHTFDLVTILYVIISCIKRMKKGDMEERLIIIGISMLAACFCFDIVVFNIAKYCNGVLTRLMGITSIGGIAFILCMLSSYAVHIYRGMYNQVERETLLGLAYTDNLTGLANVAKFNEVTAVFEKTKQAFTIILFDLNCLKSINDSQGHNMGDLLIHSFADVLRKSFEKYGTVARIGGDEFAVLMPATDAEVMNARMETYEKNLTKANDGETQVTMKAAWGIATSTENGGLSEMETKKLADSRMYEKKRVMKELDLTCR